MRRLAVAFTVLLAATPVCAEPVVAVRMNGAAANRLSVAVVGDGYTAGDMNKYAADVDAFVGYMFNQEPFKEYAAYFNVYRIDLTSNDSGIDHPEWQQLKDTPLGTSYFCGNVQRYICFDQRAVDAVLARSALPPDLDLVLILVNDPQPGGSGGRYAVSSTESGFAATMVHEAGHTLGLLADEYADTSGGSCNGTREPGEANATRQTARDQIKWRHWIADSTAIPSTTLAPATPGLYKGGNHCLEGIYRPTNNSRMRSMGQPFEQVNSEQLVRRFYSFVSPIDTVAPSTTDVQVGRGRPAAFSITHPQPASHDLSIEWTLDDQPISGAEAISLDTSTLNLGRHVVEVTVRDTTAFVRMDPNEALVERFRWTLEIVP